jgi:uncharacterized protein YggT (Ycf19 family)
MTQVLREHIIVRSDNTDNIVESRATYTASSIIYYLLNAVEVILAARFLLRLLGANIATPFVNFVYAISAPFVAPFRGMFANATFDTGVVEWTTIVALLIYAILAYAIVELIRRFSR